MSGGELNEKVAALAAELARNRRIPGATYRLQFNRHFTFRDALAIVPYLYELGITDLYASPIFKARPGSLHGYDVVDPCQLNPEIGTDEEFTALVAALQERGMGIVLDLVPNHMGVGDSHNAWWMDVLENGPSSPFAAYFDIDWHPVKPELENKMLLPLLEDQYGKVLESGKLRLSYEDGSFFLNYYETRLPLAPRTYSLILKQMLPKLQEHLPADHEQLLEFQSILTALDHLPTRTEVEPEKITERLREKQIIKRRLATLREASLEIRSAVQSVVEAYNGTLGDGRSFDRLDELIDAQAYRLAYWRVAADEVNYRRFFDINDLAAVCEERPEVFEAVHQLAFRLLEEGKVVGLRIDHPDGLLDPQQYFRKLQHRYLWQQLQRRLVLEGDAVAGKLSDAAADWLAEQNGPGDSRQQTRVLYVVVEKILHQQQESLPRDWTVDGSTGYDFLNVLNGLFVDAGQGRVFDRIYSQFIGRRIDFHELVVAAKKTVMLISLASEMQMLSRRLDRISEKHRWYRDFTLNGLLFALREVIAALPVYRTYITSPDSVSERDQQVIESAVSDAQFRNTRPARAIFDFIRDTLLLRNLPEFREEDRPRLIEFVMKFQQVTGPVMAKAVEDTAFYSYNRLVSLNEVGGHPERFGCSVSAFHSSNVERCQFWPHALLASSTHDTKRSEDVRARINVLSEIPSEWHWVLSRWARFNARHKTVVDGEPAPDRNDEYLFYQVLLGAWPVSADPIGRLDSSELAAFRGRLIVYMQKATKEAKIHTSWINPNDAYAAAIENFIRGVLSDDSHNRFLADFLPFHRHVAFFGRINAVSQLLLKLTAPGVPDIYQGAEIWQLRLVDPDNRQLVDYAQRQAMLEDLRKRLNSEGSPALARALFDSTDAGMIKLFLTHLVLSFRRVHRELFARGDYRALEVVGEKRNHVIAFVRRLANQAVLVVSPRLVAGLTGMVEQLPVGESVWGNTQLMVSRELEVARYRNLFTNEVLAVTQTQNGPAFPLSAILSFFPVALLVRMDPQSTVETPESAGKLT